ncbi:hypothetical protein ACG7TL_008510 [Trametes sanguinea]
MPELCRQGSFDIDDLDDVVLVQAQRAVAAKATYVYLRRTKPSHTAFRLAGEEYAQSCLDHRGQSGIDRASHSLGEASTACIQTDTKEAGAASACHIPGKAMPLPHTVELILVDDENISIPRRKPYHNPQRRFGTLLSSEAIRHLRKLLQGHGTGRKEIPGAWGYF